MTTSDKIAYLSSFDEEMAELLQSELTQQQSTIGLIASENIASLKSTILEGCIFTNKNTEGYAGARFVGGTQFADAVELLAIERLKSLFDCEHANLQSGNASIANTAVSLALLNRGDSVLSMALDAGGHLSHGASFHLTGQLFATINYGVKDGKIDMDEVRELALKHRPRLIIAGASAYPRLIDYEAFSSVAKEVGAYFWADIAHTAGLVAARVIPSPLPHADVVTLSTQKTLRGPRGCGVILCKKSLKNKIDRAVFPTLQGGPKADMIAARAVLFKEAAGEKYRAYQLQTLKNAKALEVGLLKSGIDLVSGGTDTHLLVLDLRRLKISGKEAEILAQNAGFITNKNMIPNDPLGPTTTSGLRIGSPLMTTRGAGEAQMEALARILAAVLKGELPPQNARQKTLQIAQKYPLFHPKWQD